MTGDVKPVVFALKDIEDLLEKLIEEVRNQGELSRINDTVLVNRMKEKN